jgi:hypothetical protein
MNTAVAHIYYFKYLLRVYDEKSLIFPYNITDCPSDTDRVLFEVRNKFLTRIYTNVSLQRVTDVCVCVF